MRSGNLGHGNRGVEKLPSQKIKPGKRSGYPDEHSGRVIEEMARRNLTSKMDENNETIPDAVPAETEENQSVSESVSETPAVSSVLPEGVNASKLNFVEISDDEVTVEKPRKRSNTAKAQYVDAVLSVANAYENGQIFRPSVPIKDDKEKYRYQNWIREANKEIGKRGLIARSEVLNRTGGGRFLRFVIGEMTDEEREKYEENMKKDEK